MPTWKRMVLGLLIGISSLGSTAQDSTISNPSAVVVRFDHVPLKWMRKEHDQSFSFKRWNDQEPDFDRRMLASGYVAYGKSEVVSNDTLYVTYAPKTQYGWRALLVDDQAAGFLRQAGVNVDRVQKRPVSPSRIRNLSEKVLRYMENHGFPFAEVRFDSVTIKDDAVEAKLVIEPNRFTSIDSVRLRGDLKVRKTYLTNYLGIKEGSPYNEKAIMQIPQRTASLRFVTQIKPPDVSFEDDKTKLTLYLNKRAASSLDGIVGVLPDAATGEILITGDAQLHLENALKQGEVFDLNWRKLQTRTQELKVGAISPYVLNSPVSVDFELKIYRRDTLFTDIFRQVGVRYNLGPQSYVRLFVDRQNSDLISTSPYETLSTPPPFLDRVITSYGVGGYFAKLNQRFNPSKGIEASMEVGVGNKEILINPKLPPVLYDSLDLISFQVRGRVEVSYYVPIVPRVVFHQRYQVATIQNQQLSNNEAFRIGGFKNLRGFDEESIFATSYGIFRTELRYLLDANSFVFGFGDVAWYENQSLNQVGLSSDIPYSFGAGISFSTRAGFFSLMYALGSQQGNPVLLRSGKVHFGFTSLF